MTSSGVSCCLGWAYEPCGEPAIGWLYQGYPDRSWEAQPVCLSHFFQIARERDARVEVPIHMDLVELDSDPPEWTLDDGQ